MSEPEAHFAFLWEAAGGPAIVPEYKFHESRRWRADFALLECGVLIEIEGGGFAGGRHTRGTGFANDAQKYLEAALAGWRVVRLVPQQLNLPTIERILSWTLTLPKPAFATLPPSPTPKAGKNGGCRSSKKPKKASKTAS